MVQVSTLWLAPSFPAQNQTLLYLLLLAFIHESEVKRLTKKTCQVTSSNIPSFLTNFSDYRNDQFSTRAIYLSRETYLHAYKHHDWWALKNMLYFSNRSLKLSSFAELLMQWTSAFCYSINISLFISNQSTSLCLLIGELYSFVQKEIPDRI